MEMYSYNNVRLLLQTEGKMSTMSDVRSGTLVRRGLNNFEFTEQRNNWLGIRSTRELWRDRRFNIRITRKNGKILRFIVEMDGSKELKDFNSLSFDEALENAFDRYHEYLMAIDKAYNGKGGKA